MDVQDYLREKERRLSQGTRRIRDFRVFDFNYIPDKPLMREEAKPIIDALLRYEKTGIANHLLVFGSRGSGKTMIVKYLMKLLGGRSRMGFSYANCRQNNTSYKILASVLGIRPRGCSLGELWERFTSSRPDKQVLILDEVDLMSEKDRNKDILYLVSRSPQNYMALLLSNNPKFLSLLDESIRSTLQPEIVHFRNYTVQEVEKILSERARVGLRRISHRLLKEIAALTVKNTNSDVRVAIKTLYYCATETAASLKENFEKARRDILVEVIQDLNDKSLLILKAALTEPRGYVKQLYRHYRNLCVEVKEEPFSYVHFYSNLSYLQSLGLILLISTKVSKTYTNRIQLTFDASVLNAIWRARFG